MPDLVEYLGDAVYASWDGYCLTLTTSNGIQTTNTIVLEPSVLVAMVEFARRAGLPISKERR